jgi:hypothetical protein
MGSSNGSVRLMSRTAKTLTSPHSLTVAREEAEHLLADLQANLPVGVYAAAGNAAQHWIEKA